MTNCKSSQGKTGSGTSVDTLKDAKKEVKKHPGFSYTSPVKHKGQKNRYKYENVTRDNTGKVVFVIKDNLNFYKESKSFEFYHFEQLEDRKGKLQRNHYYFTGYYTQDQNQLTLTIVYKYQMENNNRTEDKKGGTVVYQIQEFSDKNIRILRDDFNSNYSIPVSSAKNYFKFKD